MMFFSMEITTALVIPGIAGMSYLIHYLEQKEPKIKYQAMLIKRILWVIAPIAAVIPAITFLEIHHYWIYAAYVIPSTIWIGWAVKTGYSAKAWGDGNYRYTFFQVCVLLVCIGYLLHLLLQVRPF